MIPNSWTPYHRTSDEELVGYLVGGSPQHTPVNLIGYALAAASGVAAAEGVLESEGLTSLDRVWLWHRDGQDVEIRILSAYPGEVLVVETEYGYFGPDHARHRLSVPLDVRPA